MNDIVDNNEIDYIKDTIILIQNEINKKDNKCSDYENEILILNMYPSFYDKYTFIVKKICKKENIDFLYKMLNNITNINNGNDKLNNVEKKLGLELANKYIHKEK